MPSLVLVSLSIFVTVLVAFVLQGMVWAIETLAAARLARRFRQLHTPLGRVAVFVYSDNPNWGSYIDANILPRIANNSLILNRSDRSQWTEPQSLQVRIFEHWGGDREFNPIAILIPPRGDVEVVRFFAAFFDSRSGDPFPLRRAQGRLLERVAALSGRPSNTQPEIDTRGGQRSPKAVSMV